MRLEGTSDQINFNGLVVRFLSKMLSEPRVCDAAVPASSCKTPFTLRWSHLIRPFLSTTASVARVGSEDAALMLSARVVRYLAEVVVRAAPSILARRPCTKLISLLVISIEILQIFETQLFGELTSTC